MLVDVTVKVLNREAHGVIADIDYSAAVPETDVPPARPFHASVGRLHRLVLCLPKRAGGTNLTKQP